MHVQAICSRQRSTVAGRPVEVYDEALRQRGYCGRLDERGRRCYRRGGHSDGCSFSFTFQLMQGPRGDSSEEGWD